MASLCLHCGKEANIPGWFHLCVGCVDSPIAKRIEETLSLKECKSCSALFKQMPVNEICWVCGGRVRHIRGQT